MSFNSNLSKIFIFFFFYFERVFDFRENRRQIYRERHHTFSTPFHRTPCIFSLPGVCCICSTSPLSVPRARKPRMPPVLCTGIRADFTHLSFPTLLRPTFESAVQRAALPRFLACMSVYIPSEMGKKIKNIRNRKNKSTLLLLNYFT